MIIYTYLRIRKTQIPLEYVSSWQLRAVAAEQQSEDTLTAVPPASKDYPGIRTACNVNTSFLANCLGSNYGDKNMETWSGGDFNSSHSPSRQIYLAQVIFSATYISYAISIAMPTDVFLRV